MKTKIAVLAAAATLAFGVQAANELKMLDQELAPNPGSLRDAVQLAIKRLQAGRQGRPAR